MSDIEVRALAARLDALEKRVNAPVRANQLRSSAIENGAIQEFDANGQVTQIIGRLPDGTHGAIPLAGPPPSQPSAPTLISTPGGVIVRYDGTYVGGAVASLIHAHYEIHVSDSPSFDALTFDTLKGTIPSARGGDVVVPWFSPTPLYARVVARDQAGKASPASPVAGPVTSGVVPQVFQQPGRPADLAPTARGVWWDTDDGNKVYTWNGSDWIAAPYGNGAIGPNTLVASDVLVSGSITAPLFAATLILATTIIAGDPLQNHVTLSEGGFVTWGIDPEGGIVPTGGFGTGDDGISFVDPVTGESMLSINRSGAGSLRTLSVAGTDTNADGEPDLGLTLYGTDIMELMNSRSGGAAGSAYHADALNGVFASGITTPFGLGEVSFEADGNYSYLIAFDGLHFSNPTAVSRGLLSVRFTSDGTTPTISNGSVLGSKFINIASANAAYSAAPILALGSFGTGLRTVRCLVTAELFSGSGSLTAHTYSSSDRHRAPFRFFALQAGRDIPDTFIANDGGGTRSGYTTAPPPVTRRTYTSKWRASGTASYLGGGSRKNVNADMYQGQTPYYTSNGNQRAIANFNNPAVEGEVGKSIVTALAGATINYVEIYLYCVHSHYNSGGMARIGYHGQTSLPLNIFENDGTWNGFGNASFDQNQGRWMRLPASTHGFWKDGTYRGLTVGPSPSAGDPNYYVVFKGGTESIHRPAIRINYTR